MKTPRYLFASLLSSALLLSAASVHAQATRTWVSGVGDDVNPCSRTAPCKTFAGAISKTADKGEISVLDPGGFGTVTITKSITLNGTGTLASILAAGTNGVNVNDSAGASPNTIQVIIRDISINGANTGFDGIRYTSGLSLTVDHCWIHGFNGNGLNSDAIDVTKTASGNLKVISAYIENVAGDGVHIDTSAGAVVALVDGTRILNCGSDGVEALRNVRLAVTHSQIFQIGSIGVNTSNFNDIVNLDDVLVAQCNSVGLRSNATCEIHASNSFILNNPTGLQPNGGQIISFQGNSLSGNTTPGAFSSTTPKQ